jgi:hypothetical protein
MRLAKIFLKKKVKWKFDDAVSAVSLYPTWKRGYAVGRENDNLMVSRGGLEPPTG